MDLDPSSQPSPEPGPGPSPAEIVDGVLHSFVARLRARDLERTLGHFAHDAALFGSGTTEQARGTEDLTTFFKELFDRPVTYGWSWQPPVVARHGDLLWFVAPATAVLLHDDGTRQDLPYRLSGVLREHRPGYWLFELFNGSTPDSN